MKYKLHAAIKRVNIIRMVCEHLLGDDHSPRHRMGVGAVVMVAGVVLAKVGGGIHVLVIHYGADVLGYFLHGLGAVPFIEHLLEDTKTEEEHADTVPMFPSIEDDELTS